MYAFKDKHWIVRIDQTWRAPSVRSLQRYPASPSPTPARWSPTQALSLEMPIISTPSCCAVRNFLHCMPVGRNAPDVTENRAVLRSAPPSIIQGGGSQSSVFNPALILIFKSFPCADLLSYTQEISGFTKTNGIFRLFPSQEKWLLHNYRGENLKNPTKIVADMVHNVLLSPQIWK